MNASLRVAQGASYWVAGAGCRTITNIKNTFGTLFSILKIYKFGKYSIFP